EERVDPHRCGRPRQHRRERAIAARRGALRTGLLHRVGRVEADRCEPPHHDEPAHVHHQRVIAEGGPPLGEQHLAAPPLAPLVEAAPGDDRNPVLLGHLRHLVRVPARELLPLDHAGPGDRDQLTAAEFHALATGAPDGSTISGAVGVARTEIPLRTRCSSAALTNPAKSGCAWNGLLWNSGWYWQPMKYGCPCSSITSTSPSCSLTPLATSPFSSSCAR